MLQIGPSFNLCCCKGYFPSFQMQFSPYHSTDKVKQYTILVKVCQSMFCVFIVAMNVTPLHSNAKIGPTHFDHSSLNLEQLLTMMMIWFGLKCTWQLTKLLCFKNVSLKMTSTFVFITTSPFCFLPHHCFQHMVKLFGARICIFGPLMIFFWKERELFYTIMYNNTHDDTFAYPYSGAMPSNWDISYRYWRYMLTSASPDISLDIFSSSFF